MKKTILLNLVVLLLTAASGPAATRLVPGEYATIQAAIDAAVDGDVVIIAPDTYTGDGNRDIDFHGKAITVRSTDPNDPNIVAATIINCNGTLEEKHRAFYFHSGEDCNSVVCGLTITKGYADYGGGIYCVSSSPTITNCTFRDNMAKYWGQFSALTPLENGSSMVTDDSEVHIMCPPPLPGWRGKGGGICCRLSNPTLTNCKFAGNSAHQYGGGMYNYYDSSPILTNCTFASNSASYGGAMYNGNNNPTLINCTLTSNEAIASGGGMFNNGTSPTLEECTFSGNSAGGSGGAMCNTYGSLKLTNCTLRVNCANNYGGGIYSDYTNATLVNCTFNGNYSGDAGGGMYNYRSDLTLTNCIFSGNSGEGNGGGIYCRNNSLTRVINCTFSVNSALNGTSLACDSYGSEYPSSVQVTNSIFWDGAYEIYNRDDSTVNITYSDVQGGYSGEGNIDADPCFADPGYWDANGVWIDGDYHLLPGSPCIDAGDPNYIAEANETDLDGRPRILDGRIDMGAYEYRPLIQAEAKIIPHTINLASKGKWITCYIWLPEDYDVADIDGRSLFLEGQIQPVQFWVNEEKQVAMARFNRSEVQGILDAGKVELTITGQLKDETLFEGTDLITVIDKRGGKSAK